MCTSTGAKAAMRTPKYNVYERTYWEDIEYNAVREAVSKRPRLKTFDRYSLYAFWKREKAYV